MAQAIYDKNILEMLSLFLLQKEDLYAYEIMKQIRVLSGETLSVKGGSLYPILYKLTERGFITDRVETVGKRQRMTRVYYHLTEPGREYMQDLIQQNEFIQNGIQNVFKNGGTIE